MANTLTGLIPILYESLDTVSNEKVGMISAVNRDSSVERAAVDETVRSPIVPQNSLEAITPGNTPADSGDQTIGYADVKISKAYVYPIRWTGEEQLALKNGDRPMYRRILVDQFAQAFRTFRNQIDSDLAGLYTYASRAYGTAGTAPFGTAADFSDFAQMLKILEDNGAPGDDLHMVLGSAAIANIRGKQSSLFKANEAADTTLLRNGAIAQIESFMIHNSAQIKSHTKGTATGFDANGGEPVGEVTIVVDGSDAGTILAGDVVTWAGDTNKYIVQSATASGAAAGNIVIAKPGLRAILADTVEGTIGNSYTANLAFSRNAIVLATRQPAAPEEGDAADDVMLLVDPVTGIAYEVRLYKQYRRVKIEIGLAWGYKVVKPEHMAILLG